MVDPATTFHLISAVAALDAAAEAHESGSHAWVLIKSTQAQVEMLVKYDVNDNWPEDDGKSA